MARAGSRAILDHNVGCAERDGFQKQRAQVGEAMAGGAADWNKGVPVAFGPKGGEVYSGCGFVNCRNDVFRFPSIFNRTVFEILHFLPHTSYR